MHEPKTFECGSQKHAFTCVSKVYLMEVVAQTCVAEGDENIVLKDS